MSNDNLGDRMKGYENVQRLYLTGRTPTIIRVDGKAFHPFTKGFQRPFDTVFMETMWDTAKYLCENIMGCKTAYVQSDEITLLLTDYENLTTQSWFDKNIVKMISVSASMATMAFNCNFRENVRNKKARIYLEYRNFFDKNSIDDAWDYEKFSCDIELYDKLNELYIKRLDTAMFDSRVFNIPKEEVCNCFIWRQQDATRNAIQMLGQSEFSHRQLQGKNCNEIQEMLWQEKQINFNNLPTYQKRGACIVKEEYELQTERHEEKVYRSRWIVDENIPIFTQNREYIERHI